MKIQITFILSWFIINIVCSQSVTPDVIASSGGNYNGSGANLSWTVGELVTETYSAGNTTLTQGFQQTWPEAENSLSLKVYLEGPFEGNTMATILIGLPEFPLNQPYNIPPWNYTGTESVSSIPNSGIVDWLLLDLRDAPNASSATSATIFNQMAAFLLDDGTIVGMDGSSPLIFSHSIIHSLFVTIWHRNHLGILSANGLTASGGLYSYDFTTSALQVYGGNIGHKEIGAGKWGMAGGDGNSDGQVNNGDKNEVWALEAGTTGYKFGDFNLDGQVNHGDKNDVWIPNTGMGGQVPDTGFRCFVPD